ncbi:uncharacterized protein HMPREF1541_07998 [Cyphellophora europaea CBS 101466]|uniref:Uncharacterized protein n=1 Tax=Cyphellophora europaea (strain CBS 101466) TaxID=1220924 RepID=W2RL08_CYPE1|nr:uncharacterized protein HMPREF1541_07998 [Cyphellophora europaea CBS 101466]ETN37010.1 hypothetical protein HMPREF1541_07998 [Cyphellophora europaea CBS 101466]
MANPKTACSDDNILAVLSLANHRLLDDVNPLQGPPSTVAQGPFKSMRLLNLYGGPIDFDEAHDAGVAKMTEVRGGLHALRLPGIAEMMS